MSGVGDTASSSARASFNTITVDCVDGAVGGRGSGAAGALGGAWLSGVSAGGGVGASCEFIIDDVACAPSTGSPLRRGLLRADDL